MPDILRLRQICLAAPRLAPVVDDLQTIFGLSVCHRDPKLITYGLENALLPIGTDFLEVVAPMQPDTAAGRFIHRSQGHGGYMAIFQTAEPRQRQAAALALGVRTAHEIDQPGYLSVQLHPRDCRAAFIELGHSLGGEDRMGTWWPAGPHWQAHVRTGDTLRLQGIVLESPDPAALARLWSQILATPLRTDGDAGDADGADGAGGAGHTAPRLQFEQVSVGFEPGPADCLGCVVVEVVDVAATLRRALDCGHRVHGQRFHLGGVTFQVTGPAQAGV
jgi:hypothetical protein